MPETFANQPLVPATLASAMTGVATTATLTTGHGAKFPATGTFSIRIDDELITVGSRSGNTLSGLVRDEDGALGGGAAHSAGATVHPVVTKRQMEALSGPDPFVGCRVFRGTVQTITNDTTTFISFADESFDSSSFHDNVANPTRCTVPAGKAGKYRVAGSIRWVANAAGIRYATLHINGATVTQHLMAGSPQSHTHAFSDVLSLAAGQYVELGAYQDSGGSLDVVPGAVNTFLTLEYLGA